jgi:hypothetical protein
MTADTVLVEQLALVQCCHTRRILTRFKQSKACRSYEPAASLDGGCHQDRRHHPNLSRASFGHKCQFWTEDTDETPVGMIG